MSANHSQIIVREGKRVKTKLGWMRQELGRHWVPRRGSWYKRSGSGMRQGAGSVQAQMTFITSTFAL